MARSEGNSIISLTPRRCRSNSTTSLYRFYTPLYEQGKPPYDLRESLYVSPVKRAGESFSRMIRAAGVALDGN
jgi:hypothetical protein